jgi:uncharacterized protein (DUF2164 family)
MLQLPNQERQRLIPRIQHYVAEELDREIGHLAAGFLLDYFLQEIGPSLYNQAIEDARALLTQQLADIDDRLYELTRALPRSR